jgi:hypothetical protein
MRNLFLCGLLVVFTASCNPVLYTATGNKEATEMINHFRTAPSVSRDFKDQIKMFRIDKKATKKLAGKGYALTFYHAAYNADHPSGDPYRKKDMMTVLIKISDSEGKAVEYVDIRDIHYKNETKDGIGVGASERKPPPTCICPPPDCTQCEEH